MRVKLVASPSLLFVAFIAFDAVNACRLNSELLKGYARQTIERLLSADRFASVYWPNEPLSVDSLSKATALNVTMAETRFQLGAGERSVGEKRKRATPAEVSKREMYDNSSHSGPTLIQDIFVSCSIYRDRSYVLSINLELDNPFKTIDVQYELPKSLIKRQRSTGPDQDSPQAGKKEGGDVLSSRRNGAFRVHLPQTSLLVQLNQRIRYDDCLRVNYVQLAPTVAFELECAGCDTSERDYLDKTFAKRMSQLDAEFNAILSEKVLLALQVLLSEQRLDLDMYLE